VSGAPDAHRFAVQADLASVRLQVTRQNVHQGAFPSPVLPTQGVYLTRSEVEPDVFQRLYAWKKLADAG
jgi:hypothetical protein